LQGAIAAWWLTVVVAQPKLFNPSWCLTGCTQFCHIDSIWLVSSWVEHLLCSFLQVKGIKGRLLCWSAIKGRLLCWSAKQSPRLEEQSVTASRQRIAQFPLRHLATSARSQQRAGSVATVQPDCTADGSRDRDSRPKQPHLCYALFL
jgi:hypothetical protein